MTVTFLRSLLVGHYMEPMFSLTLLPDKLRLLLRERMCLVVPLKLPSALLELKENVDTMSVTAGALFNQVSNVMSHLGSLNAGYALDVASKMDVDFAGETTELAKGQILAQAGTAMLAQANAQGQGMLALIQS
jgi:hypothetical protein